MFRLTQGARLLSWPLQQRKLLALLLLWGCLCLLMLRSLLPTPAPAPTMPLDLRFPPGDHLAAKRAASSLRPLAEHLSAPLAAQDAQPNVIDSTSERRLRVDQQQQQQQAPVISSTSAHGRRHHDSPIREPQHKQRPRPSERRYSASAAIEATQCQFDYPSLIDLQFNNIYWQKLTTSHAPPPNVTGSGSGARPARAQATFYLYNAYYDDRWRAGLPSVRVLAMIDRVEPPPTDCLLWSRKLRAGHQTSGATTSSADARLKPIVVRAQFVYAWYPKWGNYEDGLLQPWIVTCPIAREHFGLVPESVSLIEAPRELVETGSSGARRKRQAAGSSPPSASMAMPAAYSSSSSSIGSSGSGSGSGSGSSSLSSGAPEDLQEAEAPAGTSTQASQADSTLPMRPIKLDCKSALPISNNLPVQNKRPPAGGKPQKFAVCVKGLDFPFDDVSVRLVEWIELLNVLGANKIFLYQLDVHKNISRVLDYYQKRGIIELTPLTLPGEQPNLPDLQHLYLKQHLTAKRQNELIPYNDCLYRNLYSYKYLALLDIDEIIMPLKEGQTNWHDLMEEVERVSLGEQNYSRASYNVRNVYFFDDLSGPLGTTQSVFSETNLGPINSASSEPPDDQEDAPGSFVEDEQRASSTAGHRDSAERGIPHYLHMLSHVYRSKNYTEPGQYVKCFHNTQRAVSLHNHFPMNCFGQCTTYSIPVELAHLQHYRKDCVGPLRQSCKNDFRHFTTRDTTIWKYKQRMIKRTTRVLNELGLLSGPGNNS